MDVLKKKIEACQLALSILSTMQRPRTRLIPLPERIKNAVDQIGPAGITLPELVRHFEVSERGSVRRNVRRMVREVTLVERDNLLHTHRRIL